MRKLNNCEDLYSEVPVRLYGTTVSDVWYAFYEKELCILTNANGHLSSYCYDSKEEYRDVRSFIIEEYNLVRLEIYTDVER